MPLWQHPAPEVAKNPTSFAVPVATLSTSRRDSAEQRVLGPVPVATILTPSVVLRGREILVEESVVLHLGLVELEALQRGRCSRRTSFSRRCTGSRSRDLSVDIGEVAKNEQLRRPRLGVGLEDRGNVASALILS